jgi:tetratricopeptide (TPR) repeat protein
MRRTIVLFLLLFAVTALVAAQARMGTVTAIIGTVSIDAFGKGAFIAAMKGDVLYASTILKTGVNGRATLDLLGQAQEVPPGGTVKIGDLAAAGARKGGLSWFAAVGKLLKSFADASRRTEDDAVLGSRAGEIKNDDSAEMDWDVEETDAAALFAPARKSIEAGGYAAALETLAKAEAPRDRAVAWQLSFWRGYCYFQVEDYSDAVRHLSAARDLGDTSPRIGSAAERAMLLFQLGYSLYLTGKEKEAAVALSSSLVESPDGPCAPYARRLLEAITR